MRAMVIFESMFGDTRTVAEFVAAGLGDAGGEGSSVDLLEVSSAPTEIPSDIDVLVLGAPTHAFGLSRPSSREEAAKKTDDEIVSTGIGIREWLAQATLAPGQRATAFDTRMDHPKAIVRFDHAAHTMEKTLRKLGARIVTPAEKFIVVDMTGPLADGEPERAQAWGAMIAHLPPN